MVIARGRQRRDSVALVTEGSQMDLSLILWSRDNYVVKGLLLTITNLGEKGSMRASSCLVALRSELVCGSCHEHPQ